MSGVIKPVRIKLSREKGFNLQTASLATNRLPAHRIDRRSSAFGNPFVIGKPFDKVAALAWGWTSKGRPICADASDAVARFAHCLLWDEAIHQHVRDELGGKNLACWCEIGAPCHGGPLLFVANSTPEEIGRIHAIIDKRILSQADALELFEEDSF